MYRLVGWVFLILSGLTYLNAISFGAETKLIMFFLLLAGMQCFNKADIEDIKRELEEIPDETDQRRP